MEIKQMTAFLGQEWEPGNLQNAQHVRLHLEVEGQQIYRSAFS